MWNVSREDEWKQEGKEGQRGGMISVKQKLLRAVLRLFFNVKMYKIALSAFSN